MPARLLACPACARHIRVTEAHCPFCGATCPESLASTPPLAPPPRGLSRAGLFRFNALAAAGVVGGGAALATGLTASCGRIETPGAEEDASHSSSYGTSTGTGLSMSTGTEMSMSTGSEMSMSTGTGVSTPAPTYTSIETFTSIASAYGIAPDCEGVVEIPGGGVGVAGPCSGKEYVAVPLPSPCFLLLDCATQLDGGLDGDALFGDYALCADGSYSVCTGYPPSNGGWVQVALPDAAPVDSGDDAADAAPDATLPGDAGDGG
jgi:hypothetical protein